MVVVVVGDNRIRARNYVDCEVGDGGLPTGSGTIAEGQGECRFMPPQTRGPGAYQSGTKEPDALAADGR